jgi:hypothetical protein
VRKDHKGQLVLLDLVVMVDHKDLSDLLVVLDQLAHKVRRDRKALKDRLDLQDHEV